MRKKELGYWGETLAVEHLQFLGYTILERNWRCQYLEIDIIAQLKNTIVFVEVKTRSTLNYGDPLLEISDKKYQRILNAADEYMESLSADYNLRFDIITIIRNPIIKLNHIENAFNGLGLCD